METIKIDDFTIFQKGTQGRSGNYDEPVIIFRSSYAIIHKKAVRFTGLRATHKVLIAKKNDEFYLVFIPDFISIDGYNVRKQNNSKTNLRFSLPLKNIKGLKPITYKLCDPVTCDDLIFYKLIPYFSEYNVISK